MAEKNRKMTMRGGRKDVEWKGEKRTEEGSGEKKKGMSFGQLYREVGDKISVAKEWLPAREAERKERIKTKIARRK